MTRRAGRPAGQGRPAVQLFPEDAGVCRPGSYAEAASDPRFGPPERNSVGEMPVYCLK